MADKINPPKIKRTVGSKKQECEPEDFEKIAKEMFLTDVEEELLKGSGLSNYCPLTIEDIDDIGGW